MQIEELFLPRGRVPNNFSHAISDLLHFIVIVITTAVFTLDVFAPTTN